MDRCRPVATAPGCLSMSYPRSSCVRHLRSVSVLLTLLGALLFVVSHVLGLNPTWTLTGLLLAWARIVQVVVVHLWSGITSGGVMPTGGNEA